MKVSKPLTAPDRPLKPSPISVSSANSNHSSNHCDRDRDRDRERATDDEDQSPPMSPLRLPQLSSSSSSIYSWSSSQGSGHISDDDSQPLCNSKEDRSSYNTKFAKYHLETYRKNDRIRWNFDFDHNRPLDDSHHHHHQTVPRYQWKTDI